MNFPRQAARQLCEMELITSQGQRNSLAGEFISSRFGVVRRDLQTMVNHYLLRADPRLSTFFYELSHDSLIGALLKMRKTRQIKRVGASLVLACVLAVTLWQGFLNAYSARFLLENYVQLASSDGISAGIGAPIVRSIIPANLPDIDLSSSHLRNVNLDNLSFAHLDMNDANIYASTFVGSTVSKLSLENSKLQSVDFSASEVLVASFKRAQIEDNVEGTTTKFVKAVLQSADFEKSQIHAADFTGAMLLRSSFADAKVNEPVRGVVKFTGSYLQDIRFDRARLSSVDFSDADLFGAVFNDAKLNDVDFSGAYLYNASFSGTSFGMLADGTEDLTKFKGSSWWLARGWTPAQFAKMIVQFPRKEFIISKGFDLHKQFRLSLIDRSEDDREKAGFKNMFAWFLAICGEDLETAEKHVQDAILARTGGIDMARPTAMGVGKKRATRGANSPRQHRAEDATADLQGAASPELPAARPAEASTRSPFSLRDEAVERALRTGEQLGLLEDLFGARELEELRRLAHDAQSAGVRGGDRVNGPVASP